MRTHRLPCALTTLTRLRGMSRAAALVAAGVLSACVNDPSAPLIPTPERPATILPSEVNALAPDGYPNTLSDPATVPGLPRRQKVIAAQEADLDARRRASEAQTARVRGGGFASDLARRGRTHADEARRVIEASSRPLNGSATAVQPVDTTPLPEREAPARDIDPSEAPPRAVGVTPFTGEATRD